MEIPSSSTLCCGVYVGWKSHHLARCVVVYMLVEIPSSSTLCDDILTQLAIFVSRDQKQAKNVSDELVDCGAPQTDQPELAVVEVRWVLMSIVYIGDLS